MKLFKRNATATKTTEKSPYEIMMEDEKEVAIITIANRTFKVLWAVVDDRTYKTIKNGFETKGEARRFCEAEPHRYMYPYQIEI